jgi:phenolic acid decarboxylase
MTDWRTHLREAFGNSDVENTGDDVLSADAARAMRRVVVSAIQVDAEVPFSWRNPLAVGAVLTLMIISGVVAGRWMPASVDEQAVVMRNVPDAGERRQVQFSTPGGTRIIWTIDPKFQLNEVIR